MSPAIAVPEDPAAFPPEVRGVVRALQEKLAAAVQAGDLLRARGLRLSLEVQTIFWILPDVPGAL